MLNAYVWNIKAATVATKKMKQNTSQERIVQMTKAETEEKQLSDAIIMPIGCDQVLWRHIAPEEVTDERHGLARKVSNSAKTDTLKDFLTFVDTANVMGEPPSLTVQHYFLFKFTTIQMPKTTAKNYNQRCATSLAGEFNRIQQEQNKPTISNYSASNWLKKTLS